MILFDVAPQPYSIGGLDKLICSEMEWSNIVARTEGRSSPEYITQGTLSIKCAFGGKETYIVDGTRHTVQEDRFLVLNCGDYYTSQTETPGNVESLCLFFHPKFVDQVLRAHISSTDHLLELPFDEFHQPLHFLDLLQGTDSNLALRINQIRKRLGENSSRALAGAELHEEFHLLLEELLYSHREIVKKVNRVQMVRKGTRVELFRRIERGREFIEANLTNPVQLADIANAACLSPHYLLRLFRRVYRETPHQYLTRRRIEKACELLDTTSESISAICYDLGFESPNSFSLLFRKHRGVSPRAYRKSGG